MWSASHCSFSFAVRGYSPNASPEAGAVLDVRPGKQILSAALLGEEGRAVLQHPHVFLRQGAAREGPRGNTGRRHGTGERRATRADVTLLLI